MAPAYAPLLNRDVLARDPDLTIPNLGVAQVGPPQSDDDWSILRYELRNFVCEGAYAHGLERVLDSFLRNLDQGSQPAVWVSGFYGSGKSHFVRVLEALWRNAEFPDGATARELVTALPVEVTAHLAELSTRSRQAGGLWSVGGSLGGSTGASGSVRLAMLAIVFEALGLPSQYGPGTFMLWLRQDGYETQVRRHIAAEGRQFDREVNNLYVSPFLAKAVLEAVPGFAATPHDVSEALRAQFPRVSDITNDEFLRTLRAALELASDKPGEIPLTLVVLDEVQQFIGDISERTLQVQDVVEACSSQFGGRLLFAATGQSALQGTPQLFKLRDRFTVRVQLSETDVEQVVRQVVLRKKEDTRQPLEQLVDDVSPEIDRHLLTSRIGATPADRDELVPDYPLLPTRRRFWEAALRAVDTSGQAGQLRTQLRIVQEATRSVAGDPVGNVIPGDAIFDQIRIDLLQSGELLPDVERTIAQQLQYGTDGALRGRLLALIFLINKLPTEGANVPRVLATAENLADLLVTDLTAGSARIREQVPAALDALVADSILMEQSDGQFQLQTRESQEWERDFKGRLNRIRYDDARIVGDRDTHLRQAVSAALKSLTFLHGVTKVRRTVDLHFNATEPPVDTGRIQVWVRDEWTVTEKTVRDDAREAGIDSPVIHVFLHRQNADALRDALAAFAAADETVNARPPSDAPEAQQARSAMMTRVETERQRLASLIRTIVEGARVFQGGGNELAEGSLTASVEFALEASATRLYPRFADGDQSGWDTVVSRANQGNAAPLNALGYEGEVDAHPVCQQVRLYLTEQARKGSEIRQHFSAPPFGWPQDTIHGALLALVADGKVRATLNNKPRLIKELTHTQIGQTLFVRETHEVLAPQRIAIRKLLQDTVGLPSGGDEQGGVSRLLQDLKARAATAGGAAPLPAPPSTEIVDQLLASHGNAQLLETFERRDELKRSFEEWGEARDKAQKRMPQWDRLQRLLSHAGTLDQYEHFDNQIAAISANRSLLVDPDPVSPLIAEVTDALRGALQDARANLVEARAEEIARLQASPEWDELDDARWEGVLRENGMGPVSPLAVGTEAELLRALEQTSLEAWSERTAALPTRAERAREAAAKLLQPTARKITPAPATLHTVDEADAWLADLRQQIVKKIEQGTPVII